MKTPPANPRRSLFFNCFKSWFDTVRWWGMSCAFDFLRNYWFRCFLRRVMVIFRQQKNFGPNVIYFVLRVDSCVSLPRGKNPGKQHLRIQEGHFLKIALNLDLTLPDDGKCRTFFDSPRNYWFRCFLRRVMVFFRQQKNFGPNVKYFALGISMVAPTRRVNHPSRLLERTQKINAHMSSCKVILI